MTASFRNIAVLATTFATLVLVARAAPPATITVTEIPNTAATSTVYVKATSAFESVATTTGSANGMAPYVTGLNAQGMMAMVMSANDQMASEMMSAMSSSMSSMNLNIWWVILWM